MISFDSDMEHSADTDGQTVKEPRKASSLCVNKVEAIAQKMFKDTPGSHDWTHTLRVFKMCERLGASENVDMDVLRIAALLHDIGRSFQDASNGSICHAEKGAGMARDILEDLPLSKTQKENILHCIGTHRFRGSTPPETLEAKILFDADKLDSIGAVGVARAFLFAGEVGARLHNPDINIEDTRSYSKEDTGFREYTVKLSKIKDRILTTKGRQFADERHAFMEHFFRQFVKEYRGER